MLIPKYAEGRKQGRVLRQLSLVVFDSRREVELLLASREESYCKGLTISVYTEADG